MVADRTPQPDSRARYRSVSCLCDDSRAIRGMGRWLSSAPPWMLSGEWRTLITMSETLRYRGKISRQVFLKAHIVHLADRWWLSVLTLLLFPVVVGGFAFSGSFTNVDPWRVTKGS